ncbi:MAG: hypothetical protein ACR2KK_13215 [Acidimicrobiales bacterium]
MTPTVVIGDDHAGFRATARQLLDDAGNDVAGESSDIPKAELTGVAFVAMVASTP